HRAALNSARDDGTALTNLLTGRAARGIVNRVMREIGPMSDVAPEFPLAAGALAPLRAKAEAEGSGDFSPMWAGQAAALGRAAPAGQLTKMLAAEALEQMRTLARSPAPWRGVRGRGVPKGSGVAWPAAVAGSSAPACASRAFAASNAVASAASSASQDKPARFSLRSPAAALCQTLAAM